jgi:hypothetical protein
MITSPPDHTGIGAPPTVSRLVRWAAYAVPLCVLPSALWRLSLLLDEDSTCVVGGEWGYLVLLSLGSVGLALLTLGLVHRWGEIVPGWVPIVGGRPIPILAAVVPAALGATVLNGLVAYAVLNSVFDWVGQLGESRAGCAPPTSLIVKVAYLPLPAWGPLLAFVTVAYYRRRVSALRAAPE